MTTTTQATSTRSDRKPRPGKFVWFEHASRDTRRAQTFFAEVLGWKVQPWRDTGYDMILAGDTLDTMIGGYVESSAGQKAHWNAYVSVEDVDATARAAGANGGKVVEAPHDLPGLGRSARIADPQGAEISVFKNLEGDPPDPPATGAPTRRFFWNELHTSDPASALSFYAKVLGFEHRTLDMGPAGAYHIFGKDGVDRGGVTGHLEPGTPPHWLPYVSVDDPDATVARARTLEARILVEPADIPGVGRFAVLEDPTGAVLAVMMPIPPTR
jgi:predicted enzyme related to lactoylglutathione lyase